MSRLYILLVLSLPLAAAPALACGMEMSDDTVSLAELLQEVDAIAVADADLLDAADVAEAEAAAEAADAALAAQANPVEAATAAQAAVYAVQGTFEEVVPQVPVQVEVEPAAGAERALALISGS